MRISDWSSDVCSSDLTPGLTTGYNAAFANQTAPGPANGGSVTVSSYATISANGPGGIGIFAQSVGGGGGLVLNGSPLYAGAPLQQEASQTEARRVGTGCVRKGRTRGSPFS